MALILRPAACSAVMADSRPEPGPLTRTSISFRPNLVAADAAVSAARWAANGVLLRLPLNPTVPDEAQHNASPLGSVIVTVVLLNVALMWTTARLTLRRVFRFLALATVPLLLINQVQCHSSRSRRRRRRSPQFPGCSARAEVPPVGDGSVRSPGPVS